MYRYPLQLQSILNMYYYSHYPACVPSSHTISGCFCVTVWIRDLQFAPLTYLCICDNFSRYSVVNGEAVSSSQYSNTSYRQLTLNNLKRESFVEENAYKGSLKRQNDNEWIRVGHEGKCASPSGGWDYEEVNGNRSQPQPILLRHPEGE